MDLIDRYLGAVRLLLPAGQRDDIVAELRDVLVSRRDDREAELGRPLTRGEEEDLLRDFGHPVIVAGRYGPQRYLVGPDLYPIYVFVLKLVLATAAGAALIAGVVEATLGGASPAHALGAALGVVRIGGFAALGAVTVVFWILQRSDVRSTLFGRWNPRDLPRIGRRRRARWPDHVAGIVVQTLFLLWWLGLVRPWGATFPVKRRRGAPPGRRADLDPALLARRGPRRRRHRRARPEADGRAPAAARLWNRPGAAAAHRRRRRRRAAVRSLGGG